MKKFYITLNGKQEGPFTLVELKEKQTTRETLVWCEGMSQWSIAKDVEELRELFPAVPPPFPSLPPPPPAASKPVKANVPPPSPGSSPASSKPVAPAPTNKLTPLHLAGLALIAIVTFVVTFSLIHKDDEGVYSFNATGVNAQPASYSTHDAAALAAEAKRKEVDKRMRYLQENIGEFVVAKRNAYTYQEIGGISNLLITVDNKCEYRMDLVTVQVDYIKTNGGLFKTEYVTFGQIGAHESQTLPAPDSERGTSIRYSIVRIMSTALNLNL